MAIITEDLKYETTWDLQEDINNLVKRIKYGMNMSSRRYLFVGEDHNFAMDTIRRTKVALHFAANTELVMVTERGMKANEHFQLTELLDRKTAAVHERESKLVSSDPARNRIVIEEIVSEIKGDPDYRKRLVLIFFGADHEEALREELKKQLGADEKICWWSFPSILVQADALPTPSHANMNGYTFVGFTSPPDPAAENANKLLLTKGIWREQFNLHVTAPFASRDYLSAKAITYAVFGSNGIGETQAKIAQMERTGGQCQFDVSSAAAVRPEMVNTDVRYQQLKNL